MPARRDSLDEPDYQITRELYANALISAASTARKKLVV